VSNFKLLSNQGIFVFLLLALLPLLVLHQRSDYPWEGDTAHMLYQAENIINGRPHYQTHFIFNQNYPILSPAFYPIVTPLVFSSVMIFTDDFVPVLMGLYAFIYMSIAVLVFILFRQKTAPLIAAFISFFFAYNQFFIRVKSDLMSEIPFAVFFILFFVVLQHEQRNAKHRNWVIMGLLSAIALHTRTLAYVLPMSVLVYKVYQIVKNAKSGVWKSYLLQFSLYFAGFFLVYALLALLFHSPSDGLGVYQYLFDEVSLSITGANLRSYTNSIMDIMVSPMAGWGFIGLLIRWLSLLLLLFGFLLRIPKGLKIMDMAVGAYVLVLIIYPYQQAPVRFLFPVFPFLILYLLEGIQFVFKHFHWPKMKTSLLGLFFLVQIVMAAKGNYYYSAYSSKASDLSSEASVEIFEVITEYVSEDEVLLCSFPRIVSFYTRRYTYASNPKLNLESYTSDRKKYQAAYILISKQHSPETDRWYMQEAEGRVAFENKEYILFKFEGD
jgi:hypothetical protein